MCWGGHCNGTRISLPSTLYGFQVASSTPTVSAFPLFFSFNYSRPNFKLINLHQVPFLFSNYFTCKILTRESRYPLYSRGVDRTRFEYAVYLLNKDLEQLLHSQNLDIITLRHTLPNLQFLMFSLQKGYFFPFLNICFEE